MMSIPSRREYLAGQKSAGRHLLGVFPAYFPREILWAGNILPVEIWDPPTVSGSAAAHLQPYICSIAHHGLELILDGGTDPVEGFLFPHTCDSLQNLATLINDHLSPGKPCFFFYHPRPPYRRSSRSYYRRQLQRLAEQLALTFGPISEERLRWAVNLGRQLAEALERLFALRAQGRLAASNTDFYATLRSGEFLWPEDFIPRLADLSRHTAAPADTPALVLSGVLPNPAEILTVLDEHHVRVAADDLLNGQRRWSGGPAPADDPLTALADGYFDQPPCSTKAAPVGARLERLLNLTAASGARGVIFNVTKFCEPELFDLPQLCAGLRQAGLATLILETEIHQKLGGQVRTRLEAFLEMIGA